MAAPPSPTASCCSGATRASAGLACKATIDPEVLAERDLDQQSASSQDRTLGGATSASQAPIKQQHAAVDMQRCGGHHSMSAADSQAEAMHDSMGREHVHHEQSSMLKQQQYGRQPYRALVPTPRVVSRGHGRAPLLVRISACTFIYQGKVPSSFQKLSGNIRVNRIDAPVCHSAPAHGTAL